jgi:hypothetical protein
VGVLVTDILAKAIQTAILTTKKMKNGMEKVITTIIMTNKILAGLLAAIAPLEQATTIEEAHLLKTLINVATVQVKAGVPAAEINKLKY